MALEHMFGIAGSALNAQTVRMNASASNMSNAGTVAGSDKDAFRAKRTEFKTILAQHAGAANDGLSGGVKVSRISDDPKPVARMSDPGNPAADKDGEMVEMMAASRSYQNNVEVINTARQLMARTLEIIKS